MNAEFHSYTEENKNARTFTLKITGTENCELQGSLTPAGGSTLLFRSVLELLTQLESTLKAETQSN